MKTRFCNFLEKCDASESYFPEKLFLGYSYDTKQSVFVKVVYHGIHSLDYVPCTLEEVNFEQFIKPRDAYALGDCMRDEQDEYLRENGFHDTELRVIEDFDIRQIAYRIWRSQDQPAEEDAFLLLRLRDCFEMLARREGESVSDFF